MNAIIIMAKEPVPNQVKTRLIPPLDPQTASKIYHGFLLDRIEQVKDNLEVDPFIAYTPESSTAFFEDIIPQGFGLLAQKGKNLGERLADISSSLFQMGYEKIVLMDSDSPNLPSNIIISAFAGLNDSDLVLGPCEDGGYYLIGMSSYLPQIFEGIPWSTSNVTELTIKKAEVLGKKLSLLEKWYDVDTIEDLIRLKSELERYPEIPKDIFFCRNTYEIISGIL